jgi:hypothetical protein
MFKSSICTHLREIYLVLSFDSIYILKLFAYAIGTHLQVIFIPCVSCWLKSFKYHFFVVSSITKKGEIEASRPLFVFW